MENRPEFTVSQIASWITEERLGRKEIAERLGCSVATLREEFKKYPTLANLKAKKPLPFVIFDDTVDTNANAEDTDNPTPEEVTQPEVVVETETPQWNN